MLIDLHVHTCPLSEDSTLSLEALVERARQAGLDGVCLTEHDRFHDPEELRALSRRFRFLLLPGCEVNVDGLHVVVFGLHRYEFGLHRPDFLARRVEEAGGVMILAHPYRRFLEPGLAREEQVARACRHPLASRVHAVEVWNGRGSPEQNAFAEEVCGRLERIRVAGSDAHAEEEVGTAATWFPRPIRDLDDLIRELRAGRCQPVALRTPRR